MKPPLESAPFYRRYPIRSPISIDGVDQRGLIDKEFRFFFNRIPKSANTSVAMTLYSACFGAAPLTREIKLRAKYKAFLRPSQLTEQQVAKLDGTFKFTFVRNPYSRVLSAFLDKSRKAPARAQSSFTEFCRYLVDGGLYENAHWAPQTALILLPREAFDFIGRIENMASDLMHVLARIGASIEPIRYSSNPTGADAGLAAHYVDETRRIVASLYSDDFKAFGYDPERLTAT